VVRLFLRVSCRALMSRVRSHPWAEHFPWQFDSSKEAGLFMTTRAPGHLGRELAWPLGHLIPGWGPHHLSKTEPEGLFSDVRRHPTCCLLPATPGIRRSLFFMGLLCSQATLALTQHKTKSPLPKV